MYSFIKISLFLLLGSCALFKEVKVSNSPEQAKRRICLNSEGKGRFIFAGQKHVFSFQSSFVEDELKWASIIDFPVYGRESIVVEWDTAHDKPVTNASYEQALLKNAKGLDPSLLDSANVMWETFFKDFLIQKGLVANQKSPIVWEVKDKEIYGNFRIRNYKARLKFLNVVSQGHFGRFDFKLKDKKGEPLFGMELIVRDCLEKTEF
tara:strand:+ start:194298 stop:194918 length:621 start_codon:yes stop_codon:yes gene_type:complete